MPALRRTAGLRSGGLLAIAALALHQLRYLAAHGSDADNALAAQGHGYLELVVPVAGTFCVAIIAGQLLAAAAPRSARPIPSQGSLRQTAACAFAVLAIFCTQELVEGMLSAGHAAGLDALLADRGWVALPIAVLLGALVSLTLSGVGKLEQRVAGTLSPPRRRIPVPFEALYEEPSVRPAASLGLVFGFSPRPPPFAAVH